MTAGGRPLYTVIRAPRHRKIGFVFRIPAVAVARVLRVALYLLAGAQYVYAFHLMQRSTDPRSFALAWCFILLGSLTLIAAQGE